MTRRAFPRHAAHAVLAALALLLAACHREPADDDAVVASGHVEATEVHVATKVAGKLEWFPWQEGDPVKKDETLARIDVTDARLALQAAEAERDLADAEMRLREAGSRREDVAELAARVAQARADLAGTEKELERAHALLDRGSGTTKSRDDAQARRDAAAAHVEATVQALRRAQSGSRPEELDASRARLATAQARIAQAQQAITDATVTSPVDGVLTTKVVEQGELLAAWAPLAVVTELARPWLTIYVGDRDLPRIRLGQHAEVTTDAGDKRTGTITFISSGAEFTPRNVQTRDERAKLVYRVKVSLDNADGLFKPGMPAEARLLEDEDGRTDHEARR